MGELTGGYDPPLLHHLFVTTKCYNIPMRCILCGELLDLVPIYNAGKDDDFPPSFPMCNNYDCARYGLLTVVFRSTEEENEKDKKGKRKKVQ